MECEEDLLGLQVQRHGDEFMEYIMEAALAKGGDGGDGGEYEEPVEERGDGGDGGGGASGNSAEDWASQSDPDWEYGDEEGGGDQAEEAPICLSGDEEDGNGGGVRGGDDGDLWHNEELRIMGESPAPCPALRPNALSQVKGASSPLSHRVCLSFVAHRCHLHRAFCRCFAAYKGPPQGAASDSRLSVLSWKLDIAGYSMHIPSPPGPRWGR